MPVTETVIIIIICIINIFTINIVIIIRILFINIKIVINYNLATIEAGETVV